MRLGDKFKVVFVPDELHRFLKQRAAQKQIKTIAGFIEVMAKKWGYKNDSGHSRQHRQR